MITPNPANMLRVGAVLHDTYRIERHLASGGFGNTYLAWNVKFDAYCAVKEFFIKGVCERDGESLTVSVSNSENTLAFGQQLEKFKKEARRLYRIHNDHVVRVHDLFEENGTAYYVMDFVDGSSLSAKQKSTGKAFPEATVRSYLCQILDALAAIHAAGIWHLDLKPANIMVDKKGQVWLIDFGASKQQGASGGATSSTGVCYTLGFAPPEQTAQRLDKFGPWTDFYALGATLYKLLTNAAPPLSSDINEDETPDKRKVFAMPGVSEEMRCLVVWMMQENRRRRPQSVEEILDRLSGKTAPAGEVTRMAKSASDSVSAEETTRLASSPTANPAPQTAEPVSERPKGRALLWVLLAIMVVCVGGLGYLLFDRIQASPVAMTADTAVVDTAVADTMAAPAPAAEPATVGEATEAPLSEGEKADGLGGFDDNASGYFQQAYNEYGTENRVLYFEGSFYNSRSSFPISLKFELNDNYDPSVCWYYNVDYNTKTQMSVRFTEEEMIVSGTANGQPFVMRFIPTAGGAWRGTATSGNQSLNAQIQPMRIGQ